MKNVLILLLSFLVAACASTHQNTRGNAAKDSAYETSDYSKNIYYVQHKLIPDWLFVSEGEFFNDLLTQKDGQIRGAMSEIISPEYAAAVQIRPIEKWGVEAVLFIFPRPKSPANCFYTLAYLDDDKLHYRTYEMALNLYDDELVGIVGGWTSDGSHKNYGGRTYQDHESFIDDILSHVK
ncbi:hypothetical protein [Flocculibacter collagenilyticus]|uniref:hypothetical protein n=1 Tax=Flocculibacter collagenilyticus TaxID=2744479 RepID=UPI0018F533C4|nr:hypothetical protein [Flocculibacter collagenilyticus]